MGQIRVIIMYVALSRRIDVSGMGTPFSGQVETEIELSRVPRRDALPAVSMVFVSNPR